ncbi:MAG: ATP-binding protein [Planctomycetes bacterium]|nr:ATP-binding protein [Planctomycetota bacterium]
MEKKQALPIVADWLREKKLPDLTRRTVPEIDIEKLRNVLAIVGPRRAGKTYYLFQKIGELMWSRAYDKSDILFLDFEDFRLSGFVPADIECIFEACVQLTGKKPAFLFLDEVQHVAQWSRLVRTLHNSGAFRIVVSGSNSSLLAGEIAHELRGRYIEERILPFSFDECLKFNGIGFDAVDLNTAYRGNIVGAFENYLRCGGYPETLHQDTEMNKRSILQSYYKTIFYSDILERHSIRAKETFEPLMARMIEDYGRVFSISAFEKHLVASGANASKRTIANYFRFLMEAFFIIGIEKFSYSVRKRTMNPKKVYLIDNGFSLLGRAFSENRGSLLENMIAIDLFRKKRDFFYFKGNFECDFIVMDSHRPSEAIQVCYELDSRNENRELRGIREAMKTLEIDKGTIITFDQEGRRNEIALVPAWKWLLGVRDP